MQNNEDTFLAKWLNNDLTKEELSSFEKTEDYHLYKKISDYSNFLTVPDTNNTGSWEEISNKITPNSKVRTLNYSWVIAAAASIVLFFGLFYGLTNNSNVSFESSIGEKLTYILPDSSEVVLNGNSKLKYNPSNWEKNKRELNLKGEAFFKVKKGSLFTVNTPEGNVQVLGTQFNVNSHAKSLEVKCYSGKVRVYKANKEVILTKGEAYRLLSNKEENWSFNVENKSWLNNDEHSFYNTPMSKVFSAIENQFNVSIKNKQNHINKRFTGSFSNKNVSSAIDIVFEAMNIKFEKDNNNIVILE